MSGTAPYQRGANSDADPRGEELDRVLGLELGADDYIVKPFSFRELLARIHAALRRAAYSQQSAGVPDPNDRVLLGDLLVDRRRHTVSTRRPAGRSLPREYDLLGALLDANGAVVPRDDLLDQVWGEEWVGTPRTLDVHIRWLRGKIESDPAHPHLILTVHAARAIDW